MHRHLALAVPLLFLVLASTCQADVITVTSSLDTMIIEDFPTNSNGVGPTVFVGNNSPGKHRRSLFQFDLSQIPTTATINSVQLALTVTARSGANSEKVGLHVLSSPWGEGTSANGGGGGAPATPGDATWGDNFFNSSTWGTPGGDFLATESATATLFRPNIITGTVITWSGGAGSPLATDVSQWVNGALPNYGWILIGDEATSATAFGFGTKDNPNSLFRPALTIDFTPAAVPEPGSLALLGAMAAGAAGCIWRRRKATTV